MSEPATKVEKAVEAVNRAEMRLVRPTLFIGLGGTGAAVLTALRRRIMQQLWDRRRLESLSDFKVAAFLYFDTFAGQAKDQEARNKENEPEDPIAPLVALQQEDSIQAGLDPDKYLKKDPLRGTEELDTYPKIKAWLPAEELRANPNDIAYGAGQVRAVSRLLFFDKVEDIYTQISSKLARLQRNLTERDLLKRYGLQTTDKVNIKIIGSAAGGTGSGTFIDVGYLARSMRDPRPEETSLYLLLGGAFSGQGERVLANTYAGLAELEYAMKRGFGDKPFVEGWNSTLKPLDDRPFDRIYLFDSMNTAGVGVNQQNREYIFRMIADLLIQDFVEPDLIGRRREDWSNQNTEYRNPRYVPRVTLNYGGQGLEYSRAYLGIGESTVDTRGRIEFQAQSAEVAIGLLRAYFRIDGSQATAPKPLAIDDFLSEYFFLGPSRQFVVHKDVGEAPVISDYPLVFSKLLAKDNNSLLESVQNDVASDFDRLKATPMVEWPVHAQDIKKQRQAEIQQDSATKTGLTLRARSLDESYRRLSTEIVGTAGSLRKGIFSLIDSEIGGIAYAEQFVRALKARLTAHWIPLFRQDADTFGNLSLKMMSRLYDQAAENLQKESKGGILGGPSRQRMETIVNQLKDTLTTWMQYRLRQMACVRAAELLSSVDEALGESIGAADDGKGQFSGILGEIHKGLVIVQSTIADLEKEAALIRDPDTAHNPIHQVIGSASEARAPVIDADAYRSLSIKAFEDYGGATKLFEEFDDLRKRAAVLTRIRRVASEEAGPNGVPILASDDQVPSLIEELEKQLPAKQEEIIRHAVEQSMPWVSIEKGKIDGWDERMNTVFVCVKDCETFKAKFDTMLSTAVRRYSNSGKTIFYCESTAKGRLLICTELSGLPLDGLKQLHLDWRRQYDLIRDDSKKAPLHTHKEWEKFARPTAPDTSEMKARLDDVGLFIQGVSFGLLRRRTESRFRNAPDKVGQYEINLSEGLTARNWVPVGRELRIKNFGFKDEHRAALEKDLRSISADLSPMQLLTAIAKIEYYKQHHYPPKKEGSEEIQRKGLGNLAADFLIKAFRARLQETAEGRRLSDPDDNDRIKQYLEPLLARIDDWTAEIEGSLDDVDGIEANKDPNDPNRARPKRTLKLDVFQNENALAALAGLKKLVPAPPPENVIDVPSDASFYVAVNGERTGPFSGLELSAMATRGDLTATTFVYDALRGDKWVEAATVPALSNLFIARRAQVRVPPPPPPTSSNSR